MSSFPIIFLFEYNWTEFPFCIFSAISLITLKLNETITYLDIEFVVLEGWIKLKDDWLIESGLVLLVLKELSEIWDDSHCTIIQNCRRNIHSQNCFLIIVILMELNHLSQIFWIYIVCHVCLRLLLLNFWSLTILLCFHILSAKWNVEAIGDINDSSIFFP